jgi:hypothetical protein
VIGSIGLDRGTLSVVVLAALAAVGIAILAAATSPLVPAASLVAVGIVGAIWWRPIVGLGLFVLVIAALPFGVIPVRVAGAQLTLVDAILLATYVAVLVRVVSGSLRLPIGATGAAVMAFVLVAITAFVAGAAFGPIPPELIRRFGKLLAGVLFFLMARALLTTPQRLAGVTRWLIFAGAFQGAIGASLMALSPINQLNLLTRLEVVGYPTTEVLRYVPGANNTYTNQLRAIGTSVDPNVFGGTLMLALVLIVVQWASPRPVLSRSALVLLGIPTAAGLLLSLSRASWLGLAAGVLLLGGLRYRRILFLGLIAGGVLLLSPAGQDFVTRFISGFSTADRATAFRMGEYANALTLLQRYPWLGIGFGLSPDIDVSAGVSSVYLLVGEQTGLVGLSVYLTALLTTWRAGARGLSRMTDAHLQGICAAFLAALSGALVAGFLDHYFANQAFPHAVALFWLYAAVLVSTAELSVVASHRESKPEGAPQPGPAARRAHPAAV